MRTPMSYQVLARKYRPRALRDVVGQDHTVRALVNALDADRLHHAYLFTGTRGVGKTTIARAFANCLNCEEGVSSTPCGTCGACVEIVEGRFVDLIEVDAASRTRVDDTRELLENVQYLPARGRYKVYLIDEVHMLSASSFNALLKTLEEPPSHVKFLLATTDPKRVPITVLSRCLQFNLKNILPERIAAYLAEILEAESVEFEPDALDIVADAARGSMRDALSVVDQAISYGGGRVGAEDVASLLGTVRRDEVSALLGALADSDRPRLLSCADELAERNADFADVLAGMQRALHDIAMVQAVGGEVASSVAPFVERMSPEDVQLFYEIALRGSRDLQFAPDPRVGFEMTLIRMLVFAPEMDRSGGSAARSSPSVSADPGSRASTTDQVVKSGNDVTPATVASEKPSSAPANRKEPSAGESSPVAEVREGGGRSPVAGGVLPCEQPKPDLYEVIERMRPSGVTRVVLDNCQLASHEDDRWELVLAEEHDLLLRDDSRASVQNLVSEYMGREIRVDIVSGQPDHETPGERRRRLEAARQRAAERAVESDETVQSLLRVFDGRVGSVQPLDDREYRNP